MAKVYKQISELGQIITGKTPSTSIEEYWGGNFPFITPTDIQGYNTFYQQETERTVSDKGAKKQIKTILPKNSICVTCIGSTIGKVCVTQSESITNQQINSIIPNKENDYRYIYYLMREGLPFFQMVAGGSGSGTPIISKNKFSKFKFPVEEDIRVQRRIAEVLSAYDALIENNNKRIRLLERMAENLYREWFVRFRFPGHETTTIVDGLPQGWSHTTIKALNVELETGSRPQGGIIDIENGIPSIGAENVIGLGKYNFNSVKLIPTPFFNKMKRGIIKDRDILIYKDGAYIGRTSLFQDHFPHEKASVNEHVFLLRTKNPLLQYYLFFTLYQPIYFDVMQNLNTNAAQPGLKQSDILHISIDLPTEGVIGKFNKAITPIIKGIFNLSKENIQLANQRDALLPRLISGKLEVKTENEYLCEHL